MHAKNDQAWVHPQDSLPIPRHNKDRAAAVGPVFRGMRSGSSFGEMLMSHDHLTYNTTLIADELTYVLLVDEALYERSFGAHKVEWEKKVSFVNQSPLFRNLTPVIKTLLMENLKLRDVQFGNRFIKQGNTCNSLFFVSHGWGKVIVDLRSSMTQYEAMKSNSKAKGQSSGRKTACSERAESKTKKLDPSRPLSVIERRRHRKEYGYVAIETLMRQRELPVTSAGPNDIIGDIEIIMNLPTYCASVECMEDIRVYELSKYSFYEIINQRCTQTYNLIKENVLSKLYHRAQRHKDIPLFSLLYDHASESPTKERKKKSMPALWSNKVLEVQTLTRLTGIARKTEPRAKIGDISRSHKAAATVENDSKESKYR